MTHTTRKLITELEETIKRLPEKEQEERVASYLEDLHRRVQAKESSQKPDQEDDALYGPFQVMLDANLDLPADYSETYEEHLYGTEKQDD